AIFEENAEISGVFETIFSFSFERKGSFGLRRGRRFGLRAETPPRRSAEPPRKPPHTISTR
ncbi:MAG: hypothetical protein IJV64_14335, partial [Oscillospiraceae bacterium]|nr:hypothetical protein [Oscillospiraceae bacterium]